MDNRIEHIFLGRKEGVKEGLVRGREKRFHLGRRKKGGMGEMWSRNGRRDQKRSCQYRWRSRERNALGERGKGDWAFFFFNKFIKDLLIFDLKGNDEGGEGEVN